MTTELIDQMIKELSALQYDLDNYQVCATTLKSFGKRIESLTQKINFTSDKVSELLKNTGNNYTETNWKSTKENFLVALKIMRDQSLFSELQIPTNKTISNQEDIYKSMPLENNRIFIVHGHSDEMKLATARTIEKIGLVPVILHEQPSGGRTIIEKINDYSDVGFAIVLLSPDDLGYKRDDKPESAKPRARQNVILELGFFLGKIGRKRVVALYIPQTNFEMPSDYNGVIYIPFDAAGRWQFELVKELKACGFAVDANKLLG